MSEGFTDPNTGQFHPITENKPSGAVVGASVALVLSALAGGGVAGVTSASASISESGIPRTYKSQSRPHTSIDVTGDTVRASIRLQRAGRYHTTVDTSFDDSACDAHSYGEVQQLFAKHRCRSLYRGLVEVRDKDQVILISIATVDMPDYDSATELHTLLFNADNGGITPLSQERGRYRHVALTHAPTWWSQRETTLSIIQAQPVGRTPGAAVIDKLVVYYLNSLR